MLSSKNFIVSSLIFRSLIHFKYIFVYGVREFSNYIYIYMSLSVFPALLIEEIVFSPLCILASFIIDKATIGVWVYLSAFYPLPFIYTFVFVPLAYCLITVALSCSLKSESMIPPV